MDLKKHSQNVENCFKEIHKQIAACEFDNGEAKKIKLNIIKKCANKYRLRPKLMIKIYNKDL